MSLDQAKAEEILNDLLAIAQKHSIEIYACSCCNAINITSDDGDLGDSLYINPTGARGDFGPLGKIVVGEPI